MNDSLLTVQTAIYDALKNDAELSNVITGVFDHVPKDQPYPFVTLGEATTVDASTKGIPGMEHTLTLHTWDQGESSLRLKEIMGVLLNLLHDTELVLTSPHNLVNIRFEFAETFKDPDGFTLHGVQRFRIVTDEQV